MSKARRIRKISVFTSGGKFPVLTLSYINTVLSQSAFRIYKCYIIKLFCIFENIMFILHYTIALDRYKLWSLHKVQICLPLPASRSDAFDIQLFQLRLSLRKAEKSNTSANGCWESLINSLFGASLSSVNYVRLLAHDS